MALAKFVLALQKNNTHYNYYDKRRRVKNLKNKYGQISKMNDFFRFLLPLNLLFTDKISIMTTLQRYQVKEFRCSGLE